MKSALFYKVLVGVLAILLALGGAYAGKTIHDTQIQVEHFQNEEDKVKSQLDDLKSKLSKNQEFLQRLEADPDFLEMVARQRLDYAKPGELIYRFDVDPLTGAPIGNLDGAHPSAPSLNPAAPMGSGSRHN